MTHGIEEIQILRGYIKFGTRKLKDGKMIKQEEGGFVTDAEQGRLWVARIKKGGKWQPLDIIGFSLPEVLDELKAKVRKHG
jgi:hypothetical protein